MSAIADAMCAGLTRSKIENKRSNMSMTLQQAIYDSNAYLGASQTNKGYTLPRILIPVAGMVPRNGFTQPGPMPKEQQAAYTNTWPR